MQMNIQMDNAYMTIFEQPIDKFRFRYQSEMYGTHGSLTGINTNKSKKTYPTVQLHGFTGNGIIRCSLFQANTSRKAHHSHSLVVRRSNVDFKDPHIVDVSQIGGYTVIFKGMGIIHTAKKYIIDELYEKLIRQMKFEKNDLTDLEIEKARCQALQEAKCMNLNKVCLYFEAFYQDNGKWISICEPIFSNPINNMKSALTGELKITRLSCAVSSIAGGTDLFLFVEKVGKKNIKVRFYEVDDNDDVVWEDWGRFSEVDVHHQYAIALKTPPYFNLDAKDYVKVYIQLFRPSDNDQSEPVEFRYKPRSNFVSNKRTRMDAEFKSSELPFSIGNLPDYDFEPNTISKEYNKSGLIDDCMNTNTKSIASLNIDSEEFRNYMAYVHKNSDDLSRLMDGSDLNMDWDNLVPDGVTKKKKQTPLEKLVNTIDQILVKHNKNEARPVLQQLYQSRHDKGKNILHMIIPKLDFDLFFTKFLKGIESMQLQQLLHLKNNKNENCLHIACTYNRHEHIKSLIQLGTDPTVVNYKGNTPLHIAVMKNFEKCVKLLLDTRNYIPSKLNIDLLNDEGMSALHIAVENKNMGMVSLLLDAGASEEITESKNHNNILHLAVEQSSEELVEFILKNTSITVEQRNSSNHTPLDLAIAIESRESPISNLLIKYLKNNEVAYGITNVQDLSAHFNEIKVEPIDDYDENEANLVIDEGGDLLFDDICLKDLCDIFNKSDKWKTLAEALNCEQFVSVWGESKNPSMMLFKFSEIQGTKLNHLVNVFQSIDARDSLNCVDEMLARRLEEDGDF